MRRYFIVLLIIFLIALIPFSGPWLQRADKLKPADAVMMLMGSIGDRVLYTNDLYDQHYAQRIIFAEEYNSGLKALRQKGVSIDGTTQLVHSAFLQLAVPDSVITVIPGDANSTLKEALLLSDYFKQKYKDRTRPLRIIIVSSPAHTRRAGMIFRRALRRLPFPVEIIMAPSPYGQSITYTWVLYREQIQDVMGEYVKLTAWLLIERWKV